MSATRKKYIANAHAMDLGRSIKRVPQVELHCQEDPEAGLLAHPYKDEQGSGTYLIVSEGHAYARVLLSREDCEALAIALRQFNGRSR